MALLRCRLEQTNEDVRILHTRSPSPGQQALSLFRCPARRIPLHYLRTGKIWDEREITCSIRIIRNPFGSGKTHLPDQSYLWGRVWDALSTCLPRGPDIVRRVHAMAESSLICCAWGMFFISKDPNNMDARFSIGRPYRFRLALNYSRAACNPHVPGPAISSAISPESAYRSLKTCLYTMWVVYVTRSMMVGKTAMC